MKYDLRAPCDDCPFRNDIKPYVPSESVLRYCEGLDHGNMFGCHKTAIMDVHGETLGVGPKLQHCAGALAIMENTGEPSHQMIVAEEKGLYDPERLDRSNIYGTFLQMWKAHKAPRVIHP